MDAAKRARKRMFFFNFNILMDREALKDNIKIDNNVF
jgi:hypothetical protein